MNKQSKNKLDFIKQFVFPDYEKMFFDDFSFKDPLPFFVWIMDSVYRVIKYQSLNPVPHDSLEGVWK